MDVLFLGKIRLRSQMCPVGKWMEIPIISEHVSEDEEYVKDIPPEYKDKM